MMGSIVEVRNLVKRYKKAAVNAVDGISFSVAAGEFFTLLGPNGAGKTTTISILNTTLSKTSGEVRVNGTEIDENPAKVRAQIGVIFQNPSLDQNLTAEENVRFHAVLYGLFPYRPTFGLMPESYRKKVEELAEILQIQKEIHKPIKTYSGGMKRKLEIVRGLIHKPKILFLDEPTTGLDPLSRKNLWTYLKEVRRTEKTTIFLTTHYLEEAEGASHVCIIDDGKIVASGTPGEIKKNLVSEYLLIDSGDRKKLTKELEGMGLEFVDEELIKISLKKISAQEILSILKTKLTTVRIHAPTLEEAYLEVINKNENT